MSFLIVNNAMTQFYIFVILHIYYTYILLDLTLYRTKDSIYYTFCVVILQKKNI